MLRHSHCSHHHSQPCAITQFCTSLFSILYRMSLSCTCCNATLHHVTPLHTHKKISTCARHATLPSYYFTPRCATHSITLIYFHLIPYYTILLQSPPHSTPSSSHYSEVPMKYFSSVQMYFVLGLFRPQQKPVVLVTLLSFIRSYTALLQNSLFSTSLIFMNYFLFNFDIHFNICVYFIKHTYTLIPLYTLF